MKDVEKAHMIAKKGQSRKADHSSLPDLPKHKKSQKKKLQGKRKAGELFSESEDDSEVDISKYLTGEDSKINKGANNRDAKKAKITEVTAK